MQTTKAPQSVTELLARADAIAGLSLAQLASQMGVLVPDSLNRAKGWIGQLLEMVLGAQAGSRPLPDFASLGIELKSLPLNHLGKPKESTFVCTAPLLTITQTPWEQSTVCLKLSKVLWIPVEASPAVPLAQRRVGNAILWQPSAKQQAQLKQDWLEITDFIRLGQLSKINAHIGHYLQLRPKAANAKSLCWAIDSDGERTQTLPRGFYLRPQLTAEILSQGGLM